MDVARVRNLPCAAAGAFPDRELEELKDERTEHVNRIKGLLTSQGLSAPRVDQKSRT